MAVPRATTISHGAQYRLKKQVRYDIVVALLLLVLLASFYSIIKPTMHVAEQQDLAELPHKHMDIAKPVETVDSELLLHEQDFLSTIQSCLPDPNDKKNKCGEYIPDNNQNRQRVALVAPPGEMSQMLWHWVQQIAKQHEKALMTNSAHPIEWIRTSHVPSYGYGGKTHGLTKIIRLVPKPLVMGVADALQKIIVDGEHNHHNQPGEPLLHQQDITLEDLKAVTRQFMRYHCRLSKVAAHTAVLSINLDDFMDNYEEVTQRMFDFLKYSQEDSNNNLEDEQGDMMMDGGGMMGDVNMLSSELTFVKQILTRIQATSHVNVLEILDKVLLEEMKKTKNLTTWPCESFWTVGEPGEQTKLSLFATQIARSFSPNCTAPFTNCWVKRDQCEAAGDGICKEKK